MLADELHEARQGLPVVEVPGAPTNDGVAEALNAVAARLEKIVQGL
jgi:cell division protein ZapA